MFETRTLLLKLLFFLPFYKKRNIIFKKKPYHHFMGNIKEIVSYPETVIMLLHLHHYSINSMFLFSVHFQQIHQMAPMTAVPESSRHLCHQPSWFFSSAFFTFTVWHCLHYRHVYNLCVCVCVFLCYLISSLKKKQIEKACDAFI